MSDATQAPSKDLLPCPFCGGAADLREANGSFFVQCDERVPGRLPHRRCFAAMGENYDRDAMPEHMYSTAEDASFAWNQRASAHEPSPDHTALLREMDGYLNRSELETICAGGVFHQMIKQALSSAPPPSALRPGLERAIEIVSAANVPNDYYKPFVDRLVELLDEAIGASETKGEG